MKNLAKFLKNHFVRTLIAVFLGLFIACLILKISGYSPLQAMSVIWSSIFSRPKFIMNVIIRSTPIILTGLSVAVAFKTGIFNIGAEGQFIMATIVSSIVGIYFNFHPIIQIPLVILAGVVAGMFYGWLCGFLKVKFGINEVISGIMLNWIALYTNNYVAHSSIFHRPESDGTFPIKSSGLTLILNDWKFSTEGREFFKNNQFWNDVVLKTDFSANFLIAILAAILVWIVIYKTKRGFEIRAVGLNPDAAQNAGMDVNKNVIFTMLFSGALAGLSGALVISGMAPHSIHLLSMFENNGFDGLAVALIAGASPIGCIFSGFMYSALTYAGQSLPFAINAPSELVTIMIGTVVFFVACINFIPIIVDKYIKKKEDRKPSVTTVCYREECV